jgi:hypothetical protein
MTATASHNHIVPQPLPSATPASMLIQAPRDLPVSGNSERALPLRNELRTFVPPGVPIMRGIAWFSFEQGRGVGAG